MAKNETAKATIYLDGKQAESALLGLTKRSAELREALKEAQRAGDQVKMGKIQKELAGVESAVRNVKKETFDYEKVLKNLNGASLKELKTALRTVEVQLNKMSRTDPGYERMKAQAMKFRAEINNVNSSMRAQQSVFGRAADGFNKYLGIAGAAIASFAGISLTIKSAIQGFNDYEERVANLSSLTGLGGDELLWLSQQARELGTATLDGGVLVTNGSQAIIDAFTKVGSARPELLQNKEALVEVTKNAMILSAASKEELQPSIEALTMVMNQYNTSASEARRIINTIAAGSKAGAGEIPYITQAFEKAGTVAADAGLSIETMVATIETLAPRISQPEIAGRSLKGVLLNLQAGADDTNPAIVGMSTALENLGKKNLSITQLTKMFGDENITTAMILIDNVGKLKKYELAVTGTNVALEQGAINTDTNNARLAQAKERIRQVSDELGGKLAPIYVSVISKSSLLLKSIVQLVDFFIKYGRQITIAATAIAGYTIAVKVAANWTKIQTAYTVTASAVESAYGVVKGLLTGKIKLATIAQKAWNLALKMNPIGLIVGLIAGAVAWLISFEQRTGKVSIALRKAGEWVIDLANSFIDLYNSSMPIRIAVNYIVASFKTGFAAAKLALLQFLEPMKLAGKLIKAALTFDVQGIKDAFSDFGKNSKNNIEQAATSVADTWSTAYNNALKGKLNHISKAQFTKVKSKGITDQESSGGPPVVDGTVSGTGSGYAGDTLNEDKNSGGGGDGSNKPAPEPASVQKLNDLQYEIDTRATLLAKMDGQDQAHLMNVEETQKKIRGQYDQNIAKYQQELEARQEIGQAIIDISGKAIDTLIELSGRESAAGKALFLMNQARAVGEVIFNTAIANAKAVAAFPLTAGQPWVTINTVSAGVSIASILAQSISEMKGEKGKKGKTKELYEGGYTGDGDTYEPAGIVHAGEWVAPKSMVKSDKYSGVFSWLESNRRAGNFSRVNIPAISPGSARGYATGGIVQPNQTVQSETSAVTNDTNLLLVSAINRLMTWQPSVAIELIKKGLQTFDDINKNRNL